MQEVTPQECKQIQLNILVNVAKFCKENKLNYSIAYGTLIGAIRHKGFIPWDDDIDIIMMRDEYERFVKTYKDDHYQLIYGENMSNHLHVVVSDSSTRLTFLKSRGQQTFYNGGLYIDIFPIDKVPDSKKAYKWLMRLLFLFQRLQQVGEYKDKKLHLRLAHPFVRPFRNLLGKIGKKLVSDSQKRISHTVGNLSLWYLTYPSFPAYFMDEFIDVTFENHKFKAIREYDSFLKGVYGNYMELPPEDKRVPRHSYIAYWRKSKKI